MLIKAPTLAQAGAQKSRKFGLSTFIVRLLQADCQVLGKWILKIDPEFGAGSIEAQTRTSLALALVVDMSVDAR